MDIKKNKIKSNIKSPILLNKSKFSKNEIVTLFLSIIAIISSVLTPIILEYIHNKSDIDFYIPDSQTDMGFGVGTTMLYGYDYENGLEIDGVLRNNGNNKETVLDITCSLIIFFPDKTSTLISGNYSPTFAVIDGGSIQPIKMKFIINDIDSLISIFSKFYKEKRKETTEPIKRVIGANYDTNKKSIPLGSTILPDRIIKTYICVTYRIKNKFRENYREINFL